MIDLDRLTFGKVLKKDAGAAQPEATQPGAVVLSVVVAKSEFFDKSVELLKAKGFSVDNSIEHEDGTVEFVQVEKGEEDETALVRMDDDSLLVMKGMHTYSSELKSFDEIMGARGFYHGVSTASSILGDCLTTCVSNADSQDDAIRKVDVMLEDFAKYVRALVRAIPQKAFAASDSIQVAKSEALEQDGVQPEGAVETTETGEASTTAVEGAETQPESEAVDTDAGESTQPASEPAPEVTEAIAKTDKVVAMLEQVMEKLTKHEEKNKELAQRLDDVVISNQKLSELVDTSVKKSEEVGDKLKGTVIGSVVPTDSPSGTPATVKKSEDFRTGCFDTAFPAR